MQIEGLGAGQDRGQPAPCLRLTRRSPNFRVMPNLLKCWPHLTPEERETVQFAARYCGQHIGLAAATRELGRVLINAQMAHRFINYWRAKR
jgi:hypothetical protein